MNARAKTTLVALLVAGAACYAGWWALERQAAARRVAHLQRLVEQEHALMQSNEALIAALQARAAMMSTAASTRVQTSPSARDTP